MATLRWAGQWDVRQRSRCPRDSYSKSLWENGSGKTKIRITEGTMKLIGHKNKVEESFRYRRLDELKTARQDSL